MSQFLNGLVLRCYQVILPASALSNLFFPNEAHAQLIMKYFPSELPGYSSDSTASVVMHQMVQNIHPGISVGSYIVRPVASQSFGYNTNILAAPHSSGASIATSASVSVVSNWTRHAIGASMSVNNTAYPTLSAANQTNWTAATGGSLNVGRDTVSAGYSHYVLHLSATDLGNFGVSYPVPYSDDDFHLSYRKNWARFALIPSASYDKFSFGSAGGTSAFAGRDTDALSHQLETQALQGRFEVSKGNALVAILRGTEAQFQPVNGATPDDYVSAGGFVGVDMRASSVIQYRALVGGESRQFIRSSTRTITTPTAEVDVIWMPDRMNTVTLTGQRGLFDPTSPFSHSQVMSTVRVQADHELRRNVFLRGSAGAAVTDSQATGTGTTVRTRRETQFTFGVSVNWKVNRDFTASLSYSHISSYMKHGVPSVTEDSVGRATFTSNTIMVGLSFAR
ncbi:outer membrane beta-barrel protein [Acetobacter oeni]|uniref:outer membrane beta-barrel protein n=1 Tax=Acetobacter oeni TaxID=304077 RepID=UPI00156883A0|nr:outer membrane beta-barrel protein [Acetobacter oeni]